MCGSSEYKIGSQLLGLKEKDARYCIARDKETFYVKENSKKGSKRIWIRHTHTIREPNLY